MGRSSRFGKSLVLFTATLFVGLVVAAIPCVLGQAVERPANDISRKGDTIVVSHQYADEVKKQNDTILSKVAIKTRVDKDGGLTGFQLVQIDRGSAVEKMGFKAGDVITGVNGIPARQIEAHKTALEQETHFTVTVLRRGKTLKMKVEIR